jgi:hypothetical protein
MPLQSTIINAGEVIYQTGRRLHKLKKVEQHMQQQIQPKETGAIAFRYGLIWGGIFAILEIIVLVIADFDSVGYAASIANILNLLLSLVLFFFVGMLAARQTGQVSRGSMAGFFAGTFGGLLALIAQLIVVQFAIDTLRVRTQETANMLNLGFQYNNDAVFAGFIVNAVMGWLFAIGLGAGLGALGGLLGKKQARLPTVAPYTVPPRF